jgi:hypothetical protein
MVFLNEYDDYLLVLALEPNTGRKKILLAEPSVRDFAGHLQIKAADVAAAFPAIGGRLLREIETDTSGNTCFRA